MATAAKTTLDEFLELPETEPSSEFFRGEVEQKSMPTWAHGVIQRLLSFVFTVYLRANPVGDAGSEIRCIFGPKGDERSYVPDFVFVTTERLQSAGAPFRGAPDLAVEILSPDDRMLRVMEKVHYYLAHGVRLVWVIDPIGRTVMVMSSPAASRILAEDALLDGGDVLPGFSTLVREILPPAGMLIED